MSDCTVLDNQLTTGLLTDRKARTREQARKRVAKHRAQARKQQRAAFKNLKATASDATRERLINEAVQHLLFTLMSRECVMEFVTMKIELCLSDYPWWFGHLQIDKRVQSRPATPAQREALAKARRVKTHDANEREQRFNDRLNEAVSHSNSAEA